jgi:EAL domain-containing protein (putative c-di-GMP-specific phosphodiesterase class I)
LLRSLIALGRSMNLRVVLEGIEAAHQFERVVRDMEPSEVQGFLFAKPLSTSAAVEFIEQWNRKQGTPEVERLMESVRPPADLILVKARSQAV